MRKILFRGKTEKFGNWIEGNLIVGRDLESGQLIYLIAPLSAYYTEVKKVIPETIGQYTGLTDKNETKIFEGDIVKGKDHLEKDLEVYGYIDHKNGSFVIVGDFMTHYRWLDYDVEVIGNIHDNPKLLDGE